jgi:hypothetical protein
MLFAEVRPEDQCDSATDGLGMPVAANVPPIAPIAPLPEFLVSPDLISVVRGSGTETSELRLLLVVLVDDRGVGMSVVSGLDEKWVSINDRR